MPTPEAVKLLQTWGGARDTDEAATRRICKLAGGLPLAVRLAGRYYTAAQISHQLSG